MEKVEFRNYNQMDNMYLEVEKMSKELVFSDKKETADGCFHVNIYADGFASYGLTVHKDPWHNNQEYTWSSRPEVINKVFNLNGTPFQLAKYSIGVNGYSRGILFERACEIALDNEDLLHYGYMAFFCNNHTF